MCFESLKYLHLLPERVLLYQFWCKYQFMLLYFTLAGFVHDAVLQWAYGVNLTLAAGHSPDDGFKVSKNIFNMTFEGITGTVTSDNVGDRKPDQRYNFSL